MDLQEVSLSRNNKTKKNSDCKIRKSTKWGLVSAGIILMSWIYLIQQLFFSNNNNNNNNESPPIRYLALVDESIVININHEKYDDPVYKYYRDSGKVIKWNGQSGNNYESVSSRKIYTQRFGSDSAHNYRKTPCPVPLLSSPPLKLLKSWSLAKISV